MVRGFLFFFFYLFPFFVDCDPGNFGFECNSTCNNTNCVNSTTCEPSSGHCTSGCFSSWSGPFCQGMLHKLKDTYSHVFFYLASWLHIAILNIALKAPCFAAFYTYVRFYAHISYKHLSYARVLSLLFWHFLSFKYKKNRS